MYRLSYCIILIICILSVILWSRAEANNKQNNRIVGGRVLNETQAGWHVAIIHKKVLACSGSLLRKDIVLTAASCIKDFKTIDITVKAGTINFKNVGQIRKLNQIAIHPEFEAGENSNNIALLKLIKPFNKNNHNIQTLHIPTDDPIELPSALSILGWGISGLNTNNYLTKKLRISKFKVYSERKCLNYLPDGDKEKTENVFCMGDRTKRVNICNDDIGSAAINMQYKTIYGIVSTNGACTENRTVIVTSLEPHISWIKTLLKTWKNSKIVSTYI